MSGATTERRGVFQLLTSPGPAAIAVVRLRGDRCGKFLRQHVRTRGKADPGKWVVGRILHGELLDGAGEPVDDILVSIHSPGPAWDARLHLHGSPGVVRCCRELLSESGFAEEMEAVSTLWPAENTIEAEAYALLPRILTPRGVQWLTRQTKLLSEALRRLADASDIEIARERCREIISRSEIVDWFTRPLRVALIGPPNAGKSTLANALADRQVSIVSPTPGTTRDWVESPGEIEGFPVLWLDTAGLWKGRELQPARPQQRSNSHQHPNTHPDAEAIRRTRKVIASADAVLLVLDASPAGQKTQTAFVSDHGDLQPACVAYNKTDLPEAEADIRASLPKKWRDLTIPISALRRTGLDALTAQLREEVGYDSAALTEPAAFNGRQVANLEQAINADQRHFRKHVLACLQAS